jgi:hypothetical protein
VLADTLSHPTAREPCASAANHSAASNGPTTLFRMDSAPPRETVNP